MLPICPHCNSPIHTGAEDQCPVCGYSLHRADAIFGANEVEFTRVVDAAGALTHSERMELIRALADLERKLQPIALGVYITDHGQLSDFRHHAHWILNHARIHHPSFGKREQQKAVEEAAIVEIRPQDRRREPEHEPNLWQRIMGWLGDHIHPCPPPVQQEWMLILVLDVQLEIACFSWGYKLDPYVNPDTINTCIVKTKLLFRERAMVSALKQVMERAVRHIAIDSHRANKSLKNAVSAGKTRALRTLTTAAGISLLTAGPTGHAEQEFQNDDVAEIVMPAPEPAPQAEPQPAPQPAPQPTAPAATFGRGAAASYTDAPAWAPQDYEQLMQRKINAGYNMLIPGGQEITPAPLPKSAASQGAFEESDTEVRGRYTEEYKPRPGRSVPDLNDPQKIFTDVERQDAAYMLRQLNAHCPFRIYVSIFKAGQAVPQELTAPTLIHSITRVDEYAVLIQYGVGESPTVDLGYKSIELTDEQRRNFLIEVQEKIQTAGGGVEGLLAAMSCVKQQIMPLTDDFIPLTAGTGYKLAQATLPEGNNDEKDKEKELSIPEQIALHLENPLYLTLTIAFSAFVVILSLGILGFIYIRRKGKLYDTPSDYRLASRYGASVSRHVRYLEGQEAAKAKTIF